MRVAGGPTLVGLLVCARYARGMARFRKGSYTPHEFFNGQHRFEHWYRDNSVYFITARCAQRFNALASEDAKSVFWDRFAHYTSAHTFTPIVTSVLDNHYHVLGYLKIGEELPTMMRKLHGAVAKLLNDLLPQRRVPFWGEGRDTYFDGCIRDELQFRRAYRYVLLQGVKAGIVRRWEEYPHTRMGVELEVGLQRTLELRAFLEEVPYRRYQGWYEKRKRRQGH